VGWADRQLDAFRTLSGRDESSSSISDRFAVAASSGRWQHWEVAGEQFRSSSVVGTGAGDYRFWWNEGRPFPFFVVNVHNLYLETLAESGIVGLALLVLPGLALVVAVALAVRSRPRFALARDLGVTLAAVAVYAVHTAGDWDWQLPAVLLPAVALAGAALKASTLQLGSMRRPSLLVPALLLAVSVAGVLLVAGPTASASRVDSGRAHAAAGRLEVALGHARQAERLDGRNPQAFLLEAYVLTDLGRTAAANRAYATALARSPSDWSIMADWSAALVRTGNRRAARLLVERALELNPKEPRLAFLRESVRS